MVIEFDRNEKRIVVSHARVWEQEQYAEREGVKKAERAEYDKTKKAVKNIQSKVEKATLGDLGVLADLKKKLDAESKEAAKAPVKAETPKAEAKVEAPKAEVKVEEPKAEDNAPSADEATSEEA